MNWINELCPAEFGDWRLSQRLNKIVEKLTEHPERTLPEAMGSWSETKAAYRFFDKEKVEVSSIYESQQSGSISRVQEEELILAVQDTTLFNYSIHRKKCGCVRKSVKTPIEKANLIKNVRLKTKKVSVGQKLPAKLQMLFLPQQKS
jgi:hypothetical protein